MFEPLPKNLPICTTALQPLINTPLRKILYIYILTDITKFKLILKNPNAVISSDSNIDI